MSAFAIGVGAFALMTFLDVVLQFDEGSNADAVFQSLWPYSVHAILVAAKFALAIGALMIALGQRARWVVVPLWLWVCLVEMVEVVAKLQFNISLDGDWLMIVLASSPEELRHFTRAIFSCRSSWLVFGGGLAAMLLGARWFWRRSLPCLSGWRRWVMVALLFAPFAFMNLVRMPLTHSFAEVMYTLLPADTIWHCSRYLDMVKTAKTPQLPQGLPPAVENTVGIVVVGESATAHNWGLYGYERDTTPELNALAGELVVLTNVTAHSATTGQALRLLLTRATEANPQSTGCTLAQAYQSRGYHTALVSNQSHWGRWGGVEGLLFCGCDTTEYVRDEIKRRPLYDDELLPRVDRLLSERKGPLIVFLHLQGSHEPFFTNYPPRFNSYGSQTMLDAYDNTILFTDYLLGELVRRLKATGAPAFLFYTSDHGESPRSKHWRDGSSPDLWSVPAVLWSSKPRRFPPCTRSDDLFTPLSRL